MEQSRRDARPKREAFNIPIGHSVAPLVEAGTLQYQRVGFGSRVGFGQHPAMLIIDMARAWTTPGSPFYCAEISGVLAATKKLLAAFRDRELPIFYTTTAYDPSLKDAGYWIRKIPSLRHLVVGSDLCKIDGELAPQRGELVLVKKNASAFSGTNLAGMLTAKRVDTVVLVGVTASGCVRHSAEDCMALGFRPIIPREAVGDRVPGATHWNLYEIDAKVGDVESVESVLSSLNAIGNITSG